MDYVEDGCHPLVWKRDDGSLRLLLDRLQAASLVVVDVGRQTRTMNSGRIAFADVLIGDLTNLPEENHPLAIPPEDIRNHLGTIRIGLLYSSFIHFYY